MGVHNVICLKYFYRYLDKFEVDEGRPAVSDVFVVGHKNPDTDSVCSALCYAELKNKITGTRNYKAKRAGHLNEETQFVLEKCGVEPPEYIKDVRPQVKDIDIRKTEGIDKNTSVRTAWKLMKQLDVVTLPITEGTRLIGLVTIGDIAKSYFEMYDSNILSASHTSIMNIVETLDATVITGNDNTQLQHGKMIIAATNPDMMENMIDPGDMVIIGNRYESQLCAIEMNAGCIIVCEGAKVSNTIAKIAGDHDCIIMTTQHDTYTVARLLNQAIPVSFFMKEREGLITFKMRDYIDDIKDIMAQKRHRDFPIEDDNGCYIGMISRRNLLKAGRKKLVLVDHNEKGQAVNGVEDAEILEIIDHHRLGSIETIAPVFFRNQPLGCTATIIYKMYRENNVEIDKKTAFLLCSAIISDTLIFKSPTCTGEDVDACMELSAIAQIEPEQYGREMFKAGSNLSSKTDKEIFFRDFKKFTVNDISIGVGQINSMSIEEIRGLIDRESGYISSVTGEAGIDMAYLMLTDIMSETSYILFAGKNSENVLKQAFNLDAISGNCAVLEGVVSRKKQFFPSIMEVLQQ